MVSGIVRADMVHKGWGVVAMGRVSIRWVRVDRVVRSYGSGSGGRNGGCYTDGGGGGVVLRWRWSGGEDMRAGGAEGGGRVGMGGDWGGGIGRARARLAGTGRRNGMEGGGTVTFEAKKVLLCVRADLYGGFGGDVTFNGFPLPTVEREGGEEALVLVGGPVHATLGQDVLLAGDLALAFGAAAAAAHGDGGEE